MSERFKHSINGVYRCENFQQLLSQNDFPDFPMIPIGSAGGVDGWYIMFSVELVNNERFVYPFIYCHNTKPTFFLRRFFNVIKKDGSSVFKIDSRLLITFGFGPKGLDMRVSEVLDGRNEYLDDNGGLTVEYGIHIDAILGSDGIWDFNINDKSFNTNETLTIKYEDPVHNWRFPNVLYGHKQLLRFHSPSFEDEIIYFRQGTSEKWQIEWCLQMAHGVRIQPEKYVWYILYIADYKKLKNVIQYLDQYMLEDNWGRDDESNVVVFECCTKLGLRRVLANLVNSFDCLEDLKNFIKQLNMEGMSGEAMKTLVAKIFTPMKTSTY